MAFNTVTNSERVHISFFGCRNVGKSSLVNAITEQKVAVVAPTKGTTTDPVKKTMELFPLGPVVLTDTPGFDDVGNLGALRVEKAQQILRQTDLAVLVVSAETGLQAVDRQLCQLFKTRQVPYLIVYNKSDLAPTQKDTAEKLFVSAKLGTGIAALKKRLANFKLPQQARPLLGDLLQPQDLVILVTPIDSSAPKGRLILPQQLVIRDILDHHAYCIVTQPQELALTLANLKQPPRLVITDSQAFAQVAKIVPPAIPLTSFSILMARHKGILTAAVKGVTAIDCLQTGDKVLIAEGCTHQRQCTDIGSVKLPTWLTAHTGKKLTFSFASASAGYPTDLTQFALILQCGGCMLTSQEMTNRMQEAKKLQIPLTNYGTAIAYLNGILARSINMLPAARQAYQVAQRNAN